MMRISLNKATANYHLENRFYIHNKLTDKIC